jgi:hypothetical protein
MTITGDMAGDGGAISRVFNLIHFKSVLYVLISAAGKDFMMYGFLSSVPFFNFIVTWGLVVSLGYQ